MKLWDEAIRCIHSSAYQAVLAVTGGGSTAISDLLAVPGASRSVLEAVVPYSPQALDAWLMRKPDNCCSRETALNMASVAWSRANQLANLATPIIGVACTASLVSEEPKRGQHRCFVGVQSDNSTSLYSLILTKGARSRGDEEAVVSDLLLMAIANAVGVTSHPLPQLLEGETIEVETQTADPQIRSIWTGAAEFIWSHPSGELTSTLSEQPGGLLSGSFNPLHSGHLRLRTVAESLLQRPVYFEMPITNADKPRLDFLSIEARRRQFNDCPVALTSAALFVTKARLFPQTVFVVGYDTAERLLDLRFYNNSAAKLLEAFRLIREDGCRFLVAGRVSQGAFQSLADLAVPMQFSDLFDEIPESAFREDTSSTVIREQSGAAT